MPAIVCIVCGRSDEVPKWHPDHERLKAHAGEPTARTQHICAACGDRIRAEAVHRHDPTEPPGGD